MTTTTTRTKMEEFDDIDADEMSTSSKKVSSSSPTFRRSAMEVIRKQEHAHLRMEEGLKKLLQLHTANELSSISGQLGLKILQKASVSIDQIMHFLESGNKEKIITLDIAERLLYCMWETPLLEYLRSTGHPVHPLSQLDPRKSLLSIWLEGGFINSIGSKDFVPHFITREVKKRYLLSTLSKDIVSTLEKIRLQQEKVKRVEQTIMIDRDYRHILMFFKELGDLRSMENKLRDVLVSELDIARAEKDSAEETLTMATSQLGEIELQFIRVAENLNAQLAECECLSENMLRERLKAESELQRLSLVVDSYIDTEKNRSMPRGGDLQPLCMHQVSEECNQEIYHLHEKLRRYRDVRDDRDDVLREKIRDQSDEIGCLNATVQRLEAEKEEMTRVASEQQTADANRFAALLEHAEMLVASESRNKALAREGYASALRHAATASELQRKQNQAMVALKREMVRLIDVATKAAASADSASVIPAEEATMTQQPLIADIKSPPKSPPKTRPTSPSLKKSRPTTPAKDRSISPSSPGKKRPTKAAEPEPAVVVESVPVPVSTTTLRPLPCVPPAESMAFCYYLAASFGMADDKDILSLREMDERLMMGDEDRQMLILVAKQRLEAAIALAAAEAAEAAAAALKAAKAKANKATANKAGRSLSPAAVPVGKGSEAKKGGTATAGAKKQKGGKSDKSPSPARGRTASPGKGNGAKQGKAGASPSPAAAKGRAKSPEKGGAKPNTSPGKGNKSAPPTKDKARSVSPGKKGK